MIKINGFRKRSKLYNLDIIYWLYLVFGITANDAMLTINWIQLIFLKKKQTNTYFVQVWDLTKPT